MNTTYYKGFAIDFRSNGVRIDSGRYFVQWDGFNPDGYATINAAKGAITKHTNAPAAVEQAPADAANPCAALAIGYGAPTGFNNLRRAFLQGKRLPGSVVAQILGFSPEQRAAMLATHVARPSRNKREGRYLTQRNAK